MFSNLTYKQKFFAVLTGFVLLFAAAYKKTFKHLVVAKKELNHVEKRLSNIENSYNDLYNLKNDIENLNHIIGGQDDHPDQVQHDILDFIAKKDMDVNIVSIEDIHIFPDNDFLIYSNRIELEGSYKGLVNLLYEIEKDFKNSRVVSAQLYSKKNYRTNSQKLYLKIILQNYEKSN